MQIITLHQKTIYSGLSKSDFKGHYNRSSDVLQTSTEDRLVSEEIWCLQELHA